MKAAIADKPKMKINTKDNKKIELAIKKAEGKASVRTLDEIDIEIAANAAETKLDKLGIPIKQRKGCRVFIDPGKVPGAYKYRAEGTFVTIERGSKDWFMILVQRERVGYCPGGRGGKSTLSLSELAISSMKTEFELNI